MLGEKIFWNAWYLWCWDLFFGKLMKNPIYIHIYSCPLKTAVIRYVSNKDSIINSLPAKWICVRQLSRIRLVSPTVAVTSAEMELFYVLVCCELVEAHHKDITCILGLGCFLPNHLYRYFFPHLSRHWGSCKRWNWELHRHKGAPLMLRIWGTWKGVNETNCH